MHPYGRALSPERKSSSNLSSAFSGFGKGKSKERDPPGSSGDRPVSPARRLSTTPRESDASGSPKQTRQSTGDRPNGTSPEPTTEAGPSSSAVNGTGPTQTPLPIPELVEPISPPPVSEPKPEVKLLVVT